MTGGVVVRESCTRDGVGKVSRSKTTKPANHSQRKKKVLITTSSWRGNPALAGFDGRTECYLESKRASLKNPKDIKKYHPKTTPPPRRWGQRGKSFNTEKRERREG